MKLEDVTYTYSPGTAYEMHALEHINLEFPNGQFVGIIGHTGSGKSTLVQHLNGLIRPTAGRVLYNGEDIYSWANKELTKGQKAVENLEDVMASVFI